MPLDFHFWKRYNANIELKEAGNVKETKISQKSVTVKNWKYGFSWGKDPRGYGLWWFESQDSEAQFTHRGLYSEAKREAIKWAASRGFSVIAVLP